MRLRRLQLHSAFRGLPAGFDIVFHDAKRGVSQQLEPLCFVGLNGSGKSNLLQVLTEIFYYLEVQNLTGEPWEISQSAQELGFTLEYTLDPLTWGLEQSLSGLTPYSYEGVSAPVVRIDKEVNQFPFTWTVLYNDLPVPQTSTTVPLPSHIIGYSSGQNELVSNGFIRLEMQYLNRIDKYQLNKMSELYEPEPDEETPPLIPESVFTTSRMFFLDYESNKIVILANFLIPDTKRLNTLYDLVGIDGVLSFSIQIQYPRANGNRTQTEALLELPAELNRIIERLRKCATTWDGELPEDENRRSLRLDFWINDASKEAFNHHFRTSANLFQDLYLLRLLNGYAYSDQLRRALHNMPSTENLSVLLPKPEPVELPFWVGNIALKKRAFRQAVSYRSLSDGEHQLLHVFGSLMLFETPGTLFLFDEPETHFNPEWRSKFVHLLNKMVEDIDHTDGVETRKKREQEVILTTHSPFIISDCKPEHVFVFKRDTIGKVYYEQPAFNTFGASVDLITMNVFEKPETISELANSMIEDWRREPINEPADIERLRRNTQVLGDSVEKLMFMNYLREQEARLNSAVS